MRTADENNRSLSGSDSGMTDTHLHHSTPAGRADFWFARWALRLMDGLTGATLGALFYGGWGVFANSAHGAAIAVRAGCAQGAMSFVVTLTGVTLMRRLYGRSGHPLTRGARAALGALAVIYSLIVGVHLLVGTPEILLTLAPGLPITIGFCLIFTASLIRLDDPAAPPAVATRPVL